MRERYIPAFIMLIAAAITSITNIISNIDLFTGLKRLLLVIIIFYILGLISRTIIRKAFAAKPYAKTIADTEEIDESQDQEENTESTEKIEDGAKKR